MRSEVAKGAVCPLLAIGQFTPETYLKKDEGDWNE